MYVWVCQSINRIWLIDKIVKLVSFIIHGWLHAYELYD